MKKIVLFLPDIAAFLALAGLILGRFVPVSGWVYAVCGAVLLAYLVMSVIRTVKNQRKKPRS